MSTPQKSRDIVRLRTFADDVERLKSDPELEKQVAQELAINNTIDDNEKNDLAKRPLDLKEEGVNSLDAEGVSFSTETAEQVTNQAYEEQKTIKVDQAIPDDLSLDQTPKTIKVTDTLEPQNPTPNITSSTEQSGIKIDSSETVDQINSHATSVLGEKENVVHEIDHDDLPAGEIVSDKKREKHRLIPAMGEAIMGWFRGAQTKLEDVRKEKYTVTDTEKRIETIQAAARAETIAPASDYNEVAERLKQVKKISLERTPVIVKPKDNTPPKWSDGSNSEPERSIYSAIKQPEEVVSEKPPAPTSVSPEQNPVLPSKSEEESIVSGQTSISPVTTAASATKTSKEPVTNRTEKTKIALPSFSLPKLNLDLSYTPSPTLFVAVIIFAVVTGIGTAVYFFYQPVPESVLPVATTQPIFTAQLQTEVQFSGSHNENMSALLTAVNSNDGALFLKPINTNSGALSTPNEIANFLAPQAPGSFLRSINQVNFGALDKRPFIVLKVNNFDTAFPGMLAWEQTMSADLAPLFGPVVTESLDLQARTDSQTRTAFFKDVVASNLSGRLLTDQKGADRILYIFADKQTIVITTDRLQLSQVLPLVR